MVVYVLQIGSGEDGDERQLEGVYSSEEKALAAGREITNNTDRIDITPCSVL